MDDKERKMISFQVSAEELAAIEARAAKAGLSRSEYLRLRALSEPAASSIETLEALIKHAIYLTNQVHEGLYSIAEAEGKAQRFLSTEELEKVYYQAQANALVYVVEFPDKFAAMRAEVAAAQHKVALKVPASSAVKQQPKPGA